MFELPTIVSPGPRLTLLGDLLEVGLVDATAAHDAFRTGKPCGVQTPWSGLTDILGGFLSPGLHIVHGPPGLGKTALGLQLAAGCGFPAIVVSCEMSALELLRRHIARETNTSLRRFRSGELMASTWLDLARKATAATPSMAIADATTSFASPTWVRDAAQNVRGDETHSLIVVDSLQAWARSLDGDTEYDRLGDALTTLTAIAQELVCPVVVLSERSRAGMKGGMHAGAGHRSIEYSSESVIELDRMNDPQHSDGSFGITMTISKNRNGVPGKTLPFRFDGAVQRFTEDA